MTSRNWPKILKTPALKSNISRAFSLVSALFLSLLIAQRLTTNDAGRFFLIFASVYALSTLGRFGVDNFILKFGSEDQGESQFLLRKSFLFSLFTSSVLSIIIFITYLLFGGDHLVDNVWILFLICTTLVSNAIYINLGSLFRSRGFLSFGSLLELGFVPIISIILILITSLFTPLTLSNALLIFVVANWLTAIIGLLGFIKMFRRAKDWSHEHQLPQNSNSNFKILALMNTSISGFFFYLIAWAPLFILAAEGLSSEIAIYTIALRFANFVLLIPAFQISYLGPDFAKLIAKKDTNALNELTKKSVLKASSIAFSLALFLTISSPLMLEALYGSKFSGSVPIIILLSWAGAISVLFGQTTQLLLLSNLEHMSMILNLVVATTWVFIGSNIASVFGGIGLAFVALFISIMFGSSSSAILYKKRNIKTYIRL